MKKVGIRGIAPKIREDAATFYEGIFPSLNAGATWILENFPAFYRQALADLRGRFSRGELCMMIDVMNGTATLLTVQVGLAGHHLPLGVADSFRLYPGEYEAKWGVEVGPMMEKLGALDRFQAVCLEVWAAAFWERSDYDADGAVKDHCKVLI